MKYRVLLILLFATIPWLYSCHASTQAHQTNADETIPASETSNISVPSTNSDNPSSTDNTSLIADADCHAKEPPLTPIRSTHTQQDWGTLKHDTLTWNKAANIYFEIPVFREDTEALKKINQHLQAVENDFFTISNLESAWGYVCARQLNNPNSETDEAYEFSYQAKVMTFSDTYVSISLSMTWFMGGVMDYGYKNYTFSRATGEMLKLEDIYQSDFDTLKQRVKTAIIDNLKRENASESLIEWHLFDALTHFEFYMNNGIPHVTFNKYEIAVGAAGAFDIPLPPPHQ